VRWCLTSPLQKLRKLRLCKNRNLVLSLLGRRCRASRHRNDSTIPHESVPKNRGLTVMFKTYYSLKCKNIDCPDSIFLPLPILRESTPSRLLWPLDGKPRNFLCRGCSHAYEYTQSELHSGLSGKQPPLEELLGDIVLRIEARCGEESCEAPVYILVPERSDTKVFFEPVAMWFEQGKHGAVRCSTGHMTRRIRPGSVCVQRDPSIWA
jgi:hypothetical protein